MHLDDYFYELPRSLIAQNPLEKRDASRLMVVDRESGAWDHAVFRDLPEYFSRGDVLVLNRSRVVPARLFVRRESGGAVEVLFTRYVGENLFQAIVGSSKRLKKGELLSPKNREFVFEVQGKVSDKEMRLRLVSPRTLDEVLESYGHVPLPPYIQREDEPGDRMRYQTVYAEEAGSVAAPTAGLHFEKKLLERLRLDGVEVLSLVLHVGPGTFLPLEKNTVEANRLPAEVFSVNGTVLRRIEDSKARGNKITAVGTTVTRVLESAYQERLFDRVRSRESYQGETDLFIYPGFEFRIVDRLITNFHLPKSSLLLLVCAFLGKEKVMACYDEAVARGYRFYSYGDAMLIR